MRNEMNEIQKRPVTAGRIAVAGSAAIFGLTPVLASISYAGGNNGVNMAFLRALLPVPVLYLLALRQGRWMPASLPRCVLPGILLFGCTLLLYSSYQYISPGLATTMHFLYPLLVHVYEAVVQKKKLGTGKCFGIVAAIVGVGCIAGFTRNGMNGWGIALAVASGICYTGYMIVLERESVRTIPLYHLELNISLVGCCLCGVCGIFMKKLTFALDGRAWLLAAAAAMLTSVFACVLFQYGVRKSGKSDAAVYSLLEPLTSVLFSALLLRDKISVSGLVGCTLIILGLFVAARDKAPENN